MSSGSWAGGPIFLVGLMGVGKTTLGKLLAADLGLDFYDSDIEIQHRTGADIPWIFDVEGEQGFRDRETHVLEELLVHQSKALENKVREVRALNRMFEELPDASATGDDDGDIPEQQQEPHGDS